MSRAEFVPGHAGTTEYSPTRRKFQSTRKNPSLTGLTVLGYDSYTSMGSFSIDVGVNKPQETILLPRNDLQEYERRRHVHLIAARVFGLPIPFPDIAFNAADLGRMRSMSEYCADWEK